MFRTTVAAVAALVLLSGAVQAEKLTKDPGDCHLQYVVDWMSVGSLNALDLAGYIMDRCSTFSDKVPPISLEREHITRELKWMIVEIREHGEIPGIYPPTPGLTTIIRGTEYASATCSSPCGCYINSNGHEVPRPCRGDPPPACATAKCRDGTWSCSEHPRASGTCSHHGGVESFK